MWPYAYFIQAGYCFYQSVIGILIYNTFLNDFLMSSDFIFVDPNKIPPRRSAREGGSRNMEVRKIPSAHESFDFGDEEDQMEFPEFVLNPGEFHVHFASHHSTEFPVEQTNEEADLLTQEIFFAPKPRPLPSPPPIFEFGNEEIFVPKYETKAIQTFSIAADEEEDEDINSREAILAELEDIDASDTKLFKNIRRINVPKRTSHVGLANSFNEIIDKDIPSEIKMRFLRQRMLGKNSEVFSDSENEFAQDAARAEDDWFQVKLSANEKIPKDEHIKDEEIQDFQNEKKSLKTFIAILFIVLIPAVTSIFLFSNKQNFLKSAFNSINSRFLGSSSFVIVNSEANTVFPGILDVKEDLAGSGAPKEAEVFFGKFFEENSSFNWLNIFKKKAVWQTASINGLEFLEKAKESIKSAANPSLNSVEKKLDKEISFLNFWNKFLSPGNQYLIVLLDSEISRPSGGKPASYAIVKSNGEFLETIVSGKFLVLDAASDLKKIPPEPIQVFSTSWLPSDAGWFFDFAESGKTFSIFFENVTQIKVNGVLAISKSFLKDFSFRESLIFDIESSNWFLGLVDAIERKPSNRWVGISGELEKALESHKAQFYFSDPWMNEYALNSNWFVSAKTSFKEDVLGIAWSTFQGNGISLELIESRNSIEEDGSVSANLSIMTKQGESGTSKNYFKIYIPKGSEIKNISGFSVKEKIPDFDYAGNGFSPDLRINQNIEAENNSWNADIFEESGLTVVGGWVDANPQERKKITLEYSLPFKLENENGRMVYNMKVFRPLQDEGMPFRLNLLPKDGVKILSVEPGGFVSENLGEYQGNLNSDLNLGANLSTIGSD